VHVLEQAHVDKFIITPDKNKLRHCKTGWDTKMLISRLKARLTARFAPILRPACRHAGRRSQKTKGYLHLGSRLPVEDLSKACCGTHSLVDPYFASLPASELRRLRKAYPNFEFSPKTAHAFLDDAIAKGATYVTIRIDSTYTGIIDKSSDFGSLCKKMAKVLMPNGHILITTDYLPDAEGIVHKLPGIDAPGMYALLKGRGFGELSEEEAGRIRALVTEEPTANIVKELKCAGFEAVYFTAPDSAVRRSETAAKRSASGKTIYLVVAMKK
jgi:hypothetical protein